MANFSWSLFPGGVFIICCLRIPLFRCVKPPSAGALLSVGSQRQRGTDVSWLFLPPVALFYQSDNEMLN